MVALTSITLLLGVLALVSPLAESESPAPREGFLLAIAAALEVLHGIRRSSVSARRQAATGAFISIAIALLLINAPLVASAAVLVGMAGLFLVDAVRYATAFPRSPESSSRRLAALAVAGNLGVALLLVAGREWAVAWTMAVAVALRIFGTAWNIAVSPVHTAADAEESVVAELAIPDSPRAAALIADVEAGERARAPVDRGWIVGVCRDAVRDPYRPDGDRWNAARHSRARGRGRRGHVDCNTDHVAPDQSALSTVALADAMD